MECQNDILNVGTTKELYESVPLQYFRDMRHKYLAQDHMGKVSECKKCSTRISTTYVIEECMDFTVQSSFKGTDSNDIMTMNDTTQ